VVAFLKEKVVESLLNLCVTYIYIAPIFMDGSCVLDYLAFLFTTMSIIYTLLSYLNVYDWICVLLYFSVVVFLISLHLYSQPRRLLIVYSHTLIF
jgi:hypothetical protein